MISRQLPLERSYWMVVAAATVLRPEFGATFTRGTERVLGTLLGVALAGAITVGLHPAGGRDGGHRGLPGVGGLRVVPGQLRRRLCVHHRAGRVPVNAVSPDTLSTASARLLDTLVGGTIGLIAYAVWPTWARAPARNRSGRPGGYAARLCPGRARRMTAGRRAREQDMRPLARRARQARTSAEATVARSLSEPRGRRIDADQSQGMLGAMRRLIQAVHVLRLEAQDDRKRSPVPALAPFAADLDGLLKIVEESLSAPRSASTDEDPLPGLRGRYAAVAQELGRDAGSIVLLAELDEIVDAANGLAALAGRDPSST